MNGFISLESIVSHFVSDTVDNVEVSHYFVHLNNGTAWASVKFLVFCPGTFFCISVKYRCFRCLGSLWSANVSEPCFKALHFHCRFMLCVYAWFFSTYHFTVHVSLLPLLNLPLSVSDCLYGNRASSILHLFHVFLAIWSGYDINSPVSQIQIIRVSSYIRSRYHLWYKSLMLIRNFDILNSLLFSNWFFDVYESC